MSQGKALLTCLLITLLFAGSLAAQAYPHARSGGNYMHNFYFPPAPSSTPWAPEWSADGESVAVAMQGSLWRVELATGVATELVHSEAYLSSPDFSPDGRWLVYTADYAHERIQLEILDTFTGEVRKLTGKRVQNLELNTVVRVICGVNEPASIGRAVG